MLPRFSFRIPQCERGLEALSNYHTVRETSTGIARNEPCHDWSSHACDSLRLIAESEAAHLLRNAGMAVAPPFLIFRVLSPSPWVETSPKDEARGRGYPQSPSLGPPVESVILRSIAVSPAMGVASAPLGDL
jgi:hypothetical protein